MTLFTPILHWPENSLLTASYSFSHYWKCDLVITIYSLVCSKNISSKHKLWVMKHQTVSSARLAVTHSHEPNWNGAICSSGLLHFRRAQTWRGFVKKLRKSLSKTEPWIRPRAAHMVSNVKRTRLVLSLLFDSSAHSHVTAQRLGNMWSRV